MNRLRHHLASMVTLENQIETILADIVGRPTAHPEADALFERVHKMVKDQHAALSTRLQSVSGAVSDPNTPEFVPTVSGLTGMTASDSPNSASFALNTVSTILNHAILGYTILQALSHRYRDSKISGGENTGDISEQHTYNYVTLVQEINQLVQNVVLWELSQADEECRCSCPSCGLGICLCAASSRAILNSAWADSVPANQDGILVQAPRSGSAAMTAKLKAGDMVMAADGRTIHSTADLQNVVRERQPGEDISLHVRRDGAPMVEISVTKP